MRMADTVSGGVDSILVDDLTFTPISAMVDTQNWLHLPPFDQRSHGRPESHADARRAPPSTSTDVDSTSRSSIAAFAAEHVLMRWKETYFVSERKSRHEIAPEGSAKGTRCRSPRITIDGFYYVSLCRATGRMEGLYYDSTSDVRQRLSLQGRQGPGWGSWEMK